MSNKFIVLLLLLITSSCKHSQPENKTSTNANKITETVKFAEENIKKQQDLEFYNKVDNLGIGLLKPKGQKYIAYKDSLYTVKIEESIYKPEIITPIFYKPDYNIFYIACNKTNGGYVIEHNKKKIFLNDKDFTFISWNQFLKESTGISNLHWSNNPIREKSNDGSKKINININSDFKIKDVENEWIKIKNDSEEMGWIKWKLKNDLLIDIYLLI